MALLQEMITAARALRADQKLDPKQRLEGELYAHDASTAELAASQQAALEALTNTTFSLAVAGEVHSAGASRPSMKACTKTFFVTPAAFARFTKP